MSHAKKLPACPNCGTDLHQPGAENGELMEFCPTCGQINHDVNVTFGHVLEEALEGIFHFDSKVWRTFRELLFQPGKLTVDFLEGRRARFVPPIRLYVFIALVFFFLLNHQAHQEEASKQVKLGEVFNSLVTKENRRVDSLRAVQASARTATATDTTAGSTGAVSRSDSARLNPAAAVLRQENLRIKLGGSKVDLDQADIANPALMQRLAHGNEAALDSVLRRQGGTPTWWKRLALQRFARVTLGTSEEIQHQITKNLPISMFLLMPLFALLLKLGYRRQRPLYVQHLIFSVHLHSFFFLLFALLLLLKMVLPESWDLQLLVVLLTWFYWVQALRRFSGQGWKRTLWKSAVLFGGYLGILTVFGLGLVLVSVALF